MQAIFQNFGIYLHVPFCAKSCGYCRFYKRVPTLGDIDNYIGAIEGELNWLMEENGGSLPVPETMYWGGGTPAMLSERHIDKLAKILNRLKPKCEWTVEIAPSSASASKLKLLKELGVNRVSLGVQSFNPKTLEILGRAHTLAATMKTIDMIADTAFDKFSVDLIFASAHQTLDEFESDLTKAATLPIDHISAYCLEFESGTSCCGGRLLDAEYDKRVREGDFLELAMKRLPELGFRQYEISNYSKPQSECLHNLSTWHMAQWLGLGAGAASQWRGLRRRCVPSLEKWVSGISKGAPEFEDIVKLDDAEMYVSALIFGLRMCCGVDLNELKKRFPKVDVGSREAVFGRLESEGLLARIKSGNTDRIALTFDGRMLADSIAVELL